MQTRENLRKRNNRHNLYLLITGLVVIIGVIIGIIVHNNQAAADAKAREFATTHFNPRVSIYGVQVGKLTVAQATKKINHLANNHVQLKDKKVVFSRNPNLTTIKQATVQSYFNKQHTDLPNKNSYQYQSAALTTAQKKLKQIDQAVVTYKIAGKDFPLKAADLIDQASYENNKYQLDKTDKLKARLKQINQEVSTLHKSYQFTVPTENNRVNGQTITVQNKSYGWGIDMKKTIAAVEKAFLNGSKTVNGAKDTYGEGFTTYAHGYGKSNHGIGDSYVVVSIKKQELWVVRHHKVVVHLSNVVTGTYDGKGNRTPTGVWYIMYKQSPSVLRGLNDDGTKYASKVKYWMPFTQSGCGLHDASWRTDWSKTAYLQGGSHGCVNIQPAQIHSVWKNVTINEAVVIYN